MSQILVPPAPVANESPARQEVVPFCILDDQQRARAEALRIAREVLVGRGLGSSGLTSPWDLITLAQYIEAGADPYAPAAETPTHPAGLHPLQSDCTDDCSTTEAHP